MANLSNINGKFVVEQTTGYVGIGTTDPNFLIEAAGTNAELALNAASIYRVRSTSNDEFIITKNGVGDRLTIASGGDATFASNVDVNGTQITVGTNASIFAENNLRFKSTAAAFIDHNTVAQSIKFRLSNSSSLDVTPLEITPTYLVATGDMYFADNNKIRLGAGSDLQIYSDGTVGYIKGDDVRLVNAAGENIFRVNGDTAELYYNDSKKLETTSSGVSAIGNVVVNGASNSNVSQFALTRTDYSWGIFNETDLRFYVQSGNTTTPNTQVLQLATNGNATFAGDVYVTGTTNSNVVISRDNMYLDAGQFYIGADDSVTDDSFRQRTASGSYFIESRKSGTWTNRLQINSAGTLIAGQGATFAGNITAPSVLANSFMEIRSDTASLYFENAANNNYYRLKRSSNDFVIDYYNGTTTSDRLIIDSSGNVGIGTTGPNTKLEVRGGSGTGTHAHATFTATANRGLKISTTSNPHGQNSGTVLYDAQDTEGYSEQHWLLGGNTKMVLNKDGNVGIGTTSLTTYDKLQVVGHAWIGANATQGIRITNNGTNASIVGINQALAAYQGLELRASGTNGQLFLATNGNVGIGVTSPGAVLDIYSPYDVTANPDSTGIRLRRVAGGSQSYLLGMGVSGVSNDYFTIRDITNSEYRFVLTNGGNVGIGTTGPSAKMHVVNNSTSVDTAIFESSASSSHDCVVAIKSPRDSYLIFQPANTNKWAIIADYPSTGDFDIYNYPNNFDSMTFKDNKNIITNMSGGNFGIGTTGPSYKLDVNGTIRATGDVIAYSDERVKENIKTIDNSLEKVNKLRGVEFNKKGEDKKSIGVIAQEIEKILPEVVSTDDNGMKSVAYGNITGVLIEAIKELKAEIEELKKHSCDCKK